MIENLSISNLGVIAEAQLSFAPGLTALTGETGAGKTMVLTSLGLLLGTKANADFVRDGSDKAVVEGEIIIQDPDLAARITDAGADLDEATAIITRIVPPEGRSRSHLGGRTVPAATLVDIGQALTTIHGQSDQLRLRGPANQRAALDAFGGPGHHRNLAAYQQAHREASRAQEALEDAKAQDTTRGARVAELTRVTTLIDDVDPEPGEDEQLREESIRLDNVEVLREGAAAAYQALTEADEVPTAASAIATATQQLDDAARHDESLRTHIDRLAEAAAIIADTGAELGAYLDSLDADPQRLETVHARRAELTSLTKDLLVASVDEALAAGRAAAAELASLEDPAHSLDALHTSWTTALDSRDEAARALTDSRRAIAKDFAKAVNAELKHLGMPGAHFSVDITARQPATHGTDQVDFLMTTRRGTEPRPLGTGVSGGELSRIMLAVEVALASRRTATDTNQRHTFVFDEVDAGVAGRAATAVGQRLAHLARTHQVIVITHLPQVAAFADRHLVVTRRDDDVTDVTVVSDDARETELARMLAGDVTDTARQHAAELLRAHGTMSE